MNRRPVTLLKPEFFDRDPRKVARDLLGKLLIRKIGRRRLIGRIVETEAYLGEGDDAAHSAAGKTARNAVLWGPPGLVYVYFIYGNYYCLNVSCLPDGVAGGVLFRAFEPLEGIEEMAAARGIVWGRAPSPVRAERSSAVAAMAQNFILRKISSGPGRMCEAMGVTRERDNGKSFVSSKSDLQLADDGFRVRKVLVTKRVGITKSADEPLRFLIADNSFVSG